MNKFKHDFKKRFGQNFLSGDEWPEKMLQYLNIQPQDTIIEIGPGQGALTDKLVATQANIFSVEIDRDLLPTLLMKYSPYPNFTLVKKDILKLDIESQGKKDYKVIGSLPYNISKLIIEKFLKAVNSPQRMIFIVQKEVGQDYTSMAPKTSALAIFAQIYSDVKYMDTIKNTEFYPVPEVDGGIILFENIKAKHDNPEKLFKLVKAGFLQPRKKLSSTLESQGHAKDIIENFLINAGLTKDARAGELTLTNWIALYDELTNLQSLA